MTKLKKFWIIFLSFLPLSAGAVAPLVVGGIASAIGIAGFSIYRSFSPVNVADAYKFFSSCWSCGMFGDIFAILSGMLPKIYHAIGLVTIPMTLALTAIWIAWTILSGFIGIKSSEADPNDSNYAWGLSGKMGAHLLKLTLVIALLAAPLPRMITSAIVEPVFNIGLSVSNTANNVAPTESENSFESCLVATAVAEAIDHPARNNPDALRVDAFSPKLRHNMTCQLGGIHKMTGLGMTVGWTMLNMAFNGKYMHTITAWDIPLFPNIPLILAGALIAILFFFALIPIPVYFLEVIIKFSMNLVMLPLMLLGWLFEGWKIVPKGKDNIKSMIDEVIQGAVGIAVVGIFVLFSTMFINSVFSFKGVDNLRIAMETGGPESSKILMDGLLMNNDSMITVILMGIFIAMFMTSIPALIKTLFNIEVPKEYYGKAEAGVKKVWGNAKDWWKGATK